VPSCLRPCGSPAAAPHPGSGWPGVQKLVPGQVLGPHNLRLYHDVLCAHVWNHRHRVYPGSEPQSASVPSRFWATKVSSCRDGVRCGRTCRHISRLHSPRAIKHRASVSVGAAFEHIRVPLATASRPLCLMPARPVVRLGTASGREGRPSWFTHRRGGGPRQVPRRRCGVLCAAAG
jgi:hypothetical protein